MPGAVRIKSIDSVYHIMVRSSDGLTLFRENKHRDTFHIVDEGFIMQLFNQNG
ncbi:hypothetical protein [Fonticella tunisiensis]|uniref:Uncharacterized protein n=1 Tax=Fonticella tunisiensis TaxID=1096341 RepID=A0A4R7KPF4_9CLOT|nr:hypothetical protein [Fonticella tunisiensis]TDT58466.1 hypothetical protein EDD71_111118 [Fonticella tunisiensis]